MAIHLYNSLTRRKQLFEPQDPERVTMYVCGPTVYSHPHIGNARPAVIFDLLFRVLKRRYPNVIYARNITDLDDKINNAAKQAGVPIEVITNRFTEIYHDDMAALGVLPPSLEPPQQNAPPAQQLIAADEARIFLASFGVRESQEGRNPYPILWNGLRSRIAGR